VLAAVHRLHRPDDFRRVMRHGRRAGRGAVTVHVSFDSAATSGVRVGLVVSKTVGGSVVRHRVARRLRHICADLLPAIAPGTDIVIRANPVAAQAKSEVLRADVRAALVRLGVTS
jgi:ribonuclease P protein component